MPQHKLAFGQTPLPESELIGPTTQSSKYQQLLEWYGVLTQPQQDELIGDCPFQDCPAFLEGKPDKFTMHRQTAQWRCFVCGRQGNAYGFINEIHRNYLATTTEAKYIELVALRKHAIEVADLVDMEIAFNHVTGEWMFPARNTEGRITNLYVWREQFDPNKGTKYRQFMSAPSMSHIPYGIHKLRSATNRPIWITEGQWDYLALQGLLRRVEMSNSFDILAAPGAGTFPRKSLSCLNGRDIILFYDNDKAGQSGMDSLINAIAANSVMPLSCRRVEWPPGLKEGFDLSDVITSLPKEHWKKEGK